MTGSLRAPVSEGFSPLSSGSPVSSSAGRAADRRPAPPYCPFPRHFQGQGERKGPLKDGHVEAARDPMAVARHVEARCRGSRVRAGREIQLLSILVEGRLGRVAHPVGQLGRMGGLKGIDEDRVQVAGQPLGVSQPPAVRRPAQLKLLLVLSPGVHLDRRRVGKVDVPEVQPLVRVGDLLAVGRPGGMVEERGRDAEVDDRVVPRPLWSRICRAYSPDSSEK